jgi:hypothetical protein
MRCGYLTDALAGPWRLRTRPSPPADDIGRRLTERLPQAPHVFVDPTQAPAEPAGRAVQLTLMLPVLSTALMVSGEDSCCGTETVVWPDPSRVMTW